MPREVQVRGLYLRESSERAGDLLLMEERIVYTVLRFTLSLSAFRPSIYVLRRVSCPPFPCSVPSALTLPASSSFFRLHTFPHLTFLCLLPFRPLYLTALSLSLESPGCIQVKLLIASAVRV